jgi:hypothetical protein
MIKICKSHFIPSKIRLPGEDTLVTFQGNIKLAEEGLNTGFIGRSVALTCFEDLLVCNLRNNGVEIGLLNGDSLF